jgi:hypothetical protein
MKMSWATMPVGDTTLPFLIRMRAMSVSSPENLVGHSATRSS